MAGEFKAFKAQFKDFDFKAATPEEEKKHVIVKKAVYSKEEVDKW
jgi:hypothetical protein